MPNYSSYSNVASAWTIPDSSPLAKYYFDAGSGTEVLDLSGNGYDIDIPQDATTPIWGTGRLIFTPTKYLISPVLALDTNASFTIMMSVVASNKSDGKSFFSVGTRDSDWKFTYLQGSRGFSVNANTPANLPTRLPHTTMCVIFLIQDAVANTTTLYRPDTGETAVYAGRIGTTTNVQISWGIVLRTALYNPCDACEFASTTVWTKVLSSGEMASEYGYESQRLGINTFPATINDDFDRVDTTAGSIGVSTSGWKWDYRNVLGWEYTPSKGYVSDNKWILEDVNDFAYAAAILKNKVTRLGATISFTGTGTDDSVFTIANCLTDTWLNNMIHININPWLLQVSVWEGSPMKTLISTGITIPRDGSLCDVEVIIDGNTLTVKIEGNADRVITDALIGSKNGRYLFFEESVGTTSLVRCHKMWAE